MSLEAGEGSSFSLVHVSIDVKNGTDATPTVEQGLRAFCDALSAYSRPGMRDLALTAAVGSLTFAFVDVRRILLACPRLDALRLHAVSISDNGGEDGQTSGGQEMPTCPLDVFTSLDCRFEGPIVPLLAALLGAVLEATQVSWAAAGRRRTRDR